jgi:transposase-like protein
MTDTNKSFKKHLPSAEDIAKEMAKIKSPDDFFGKDGAFAKLFSKTMKEMVEAELSDHLGYEKHSVSGNNSGNSRNGSYQRKFRTSTGDTKIEVARDRKGTFSSGVIKKYQTSSNEIEDKITAMYARGMTVRDIQSLLDETYGLELSAAAISQITDKIWPLVEEWQSRPLEKCYALLFLDCIHVRMKRDGRVQNTAIYTVLAVNLDGKKDILGHWVGDGGEGSSFWLSVIEEIQLRGVSDILIASVDGLSGFTEAIHSIFPNTIVQKCIVHQVRNSLRYVTWKDRKEFVSDLKDIYKAPTLEKAESNLDILEEKWSSKYAIAVKSWRNNWSELTTFFNFSQELRRLMYTTNAIESYNRQLRKAIKTKSLFPTPESVRKMLFLVTKNIEKKWTMPIHNWAKILNQLAIKFEGRFDI